MTPRKPKACKHCRQPFVPTRAMQKVCSPLCALGLAQSERAKAEHKAQIRETKARKEAIKTRSQWMKEAQVEFNRWIRARDAGKPCICCGRFPANGDEPNAWDAGHYRSVGSAPHLRFDPDNAHRQLKQCNRWGAGRAVDYRIGLIERIGLYAVEVLEADQEPRHYSIDDLKAIKATYAAKRREIERAQS